MATTFKFLTSILLLSLIFEASVGCTLNDLLIVQTKTGRVFQGKPEWKVQAINRCNCALSQINLTCQGFQSAYPLDPTVLSVGGNQCLLYDGHLLPSNTTDVFGYAWNPPYPFRLVSAVVTGPCRGSS